MSMETSECLSAAAVGGEQRRANRPGSAEPRTGGRCLRPKAKQARADRTPANGATQTDGTGLRALFVNSVFMVSAWMRLRLPQI
jgi:hypothetical protein